MKRMPLLLMVSLLALFSCEPDTISSELAANTDKGSGLSFRYDLQQEFPVIHTAIIDFENFNAGDIVSVIELPSPFQNANAFGNNPDLGENNTAMVFDSSNPTGDDFDLGTPNEAFGGPGRGDGGTESNDTALGNVLILSEDLDSSDPDDAFVIGSSFIFDFSATPNLTLHSFDILDLEDCTEPTVVTLRDIDGNVLLSKELPFNGNNSKLNVDLESTPNVAFMEIAMNNSGAIDNISLETEAMEGCVDCDSDIVSLSFRYIGEVAEADVRIATGDDETIFEATISQGGEFTINGTDSEGRFGSDIEIFINGQNIAMLATDCSQVIGPGFFLEGLEITSGRTLSGGMLCPVEVF
ncbi:hypothetical protein GWK08_15395 [Leptobacterium flavescens]|uniref:Uncharacterized protein n=1 Tax=Leptobacterium flavescens TaxID=472055 RepID=A0A6P0UQS5_9FLAO|nr:hypothetical protein [Leptobacterium flavescens]NER14840.1 hypothetical protein [Leptobacterium flavescens]